MHRWSSAGARQNICKCVYLLAAACANGQHNVGVSKHKIPAAIKNTFFCAGAKNQCFYPLILYSKNFNDAIPFISL
jgi:hypothetical protein